MRYPSPLSILSAIPARLALLAVIGLVLAMAPAHAAADSLVYVASGKVQVAGADGSQARAVSPSGNWMWPSESNGGTIAALSSDDYKVYEFDQQGNSLLSSPIVTPASTVGVGADYYVNHIRISPDGSRLAYNVVNCCGYSGESTFLQPTRAGNSSWSDFFDDYINPVWVDASNDPNLGAQDGLGLGHNGYNWTGGCCQFGIWNAGNASDNNGWASDSTIPNSNWEFEVAYTRNLSHLALFLDDSPYYTGVAHNVEIALESVDWSNGGTRTVDCTIPLQASSYNQIPQTLDSISYSSDGSTLAWAEDQGIWEANVASPSDCTGVKNSVHLAVPGGSYPYFGAAALSAPKSPTKGTTNPAAAPNTRITRATINHRKRTATFRFKGSGGVGKLTYKCRLDHRSWTKCGTKVTYKHLRHGRHSFSVKATDQRGKADPSPASKRFKV